MTVLTGETGAGKSILLDSMGLILGNRAESGLLRKGETQASVTASFDLPGTHDIYKILADQGLDTDGGELIIRRTLNNTGGSKAFINDQPISVSLLKDIGEQLVDIHGQFQTHGLMDSKNHGDLLDHFGGLDTDVSAVKQAWTSWRQAQKTLRDHQDKLEKAKADEEYLTACIAELQKINPEHGEEDILLEKRQRLQHYEAVIEGLNEAYQSMEGDKAANDSLYRAIRALEKIAAHAPDTIDPMITEMDNNLSALRDIAANIEMFGHNFGEDDNIEHVDDRLHELRGMARKHNVLCDDLPTLLNDMETKIATLRADDKLSAVLRAELEKTESAYWDVAKTLSAKRSAIANDLGAQIMAELPDLKLANAVFRVAVTQTETPSAHGIDDVQFLIQTNKGSPEGELGKVASGGELSRIMLALKVVLSKTSLVPVMVFDEVDSGIGGSTADAVGTRLSRMSDTAQILVVTHSPQVAAKANHHWIVSKAETDGGQTTTSVDPILDETARIDEIARMVSGASLTDEARAAARVLRNAA